MANEKQIVHLKKYSRRSLLVFPDSHPDAGSILNPPQVPPNGELDQVQKNIFESRQVFSSYISKSVIDIFEKIPFWQQASPILLGSWGRDELCPQSDIDILFLGPEDIVKSVVDKIQEAGFRLRYRIPEDVNDWSVGVDVTDILALWQAKAVFSETQYLLSQQKSKIFSSIQLKKKIVRHLLLERKQRATRFDSIQSFLEPNIKFGAGGLRDLFQGEVVLDLFPQCFVESGHERAILQYYREFFLLLRQKMQWQGLSDILLASEQIELSRWFGFASEKEMMREIHRGLSRVSFYSEWILHTAIKKKEQNKKKIFSSLLGMAKALKKDSSILNQYQVRLQLNKVAGSTGTQKKFRGLLSQAELNLQRKQILQELLAPKIIVSKTQLIKHDQWVQSVFRSRLIDKLCPRFSRLVGYVQHDQYHRYTADAHIMQVCREQLRGRLIKGRMASLIKKMSKKDWQIIAWTSLYHDLAKGLPDDHSNLGSDWVALDFKKWQIDKDVIKEVSWMVRNHLQISQAAFRKNSQSPQTWQDLQDVDMNIERMYRLSLFTVFDILGTNPEAWTDWKERLLLDLIHRYESQTAQGYLQLRKSKLPVEFLSGVDLQVFEMFSPESLHKDLQALATQKQSWGLLVDRKKNFWLRYYQKNDESGLLSRLTTNLYLQGVSIQHAVIHTLPENFGVYDLFQVQSKKYSRSQIDKMIDRLQKMTEVVDSDAQAQIKLPKLEYLDLQVVGENESVFTFSLRGIDQKGLLLSAVYHLKELNCEILSAKVHTWGRQIEDVFEIKQNDLTRNKELFLKSLKDRLT